MMSEKIYEGREDASPVAAEISSDNNHHVHAWSREHIPLNPKNACREFRGKLQERISHLDATDNPFLMLEARYATVGNKPRGDLENLLFYNVHYQPFAKVVRRGVRFRQIPWDETTDLPDSARHYYAYALAADDGRNSSGDGETLFGRSPAIRELHADFANFSCLTSWVPVWFALRDKTADAVVTKHDRRPFGIAAVLRGRGITRKSGLVGLVKPIFDGIAAALHRQSPTTDDAEIIERLLKRFPKNCRESTSSASIRQRLFSDASEPLLPGQLVRLYRDGIACCSADDLCVRGELVLEEDQSSDDWELDVRIYPVDDLD